MTILTFEGKAPRIDPNAFVAPGARLIGDIEIGPEASVWYNCVLRGDMNRIRIGARSNVQDGSCLHMTTDLSHAVIGEDVTVGHNAIVHGATVEDGALIGMGSILLDNAVIGSESLVAAGGLVPADFVAPSRVLVRGSPAKVIRDLTEEEWTLGRRLAERYVGVARDHAREDAS